MPRTETRERGLYKNGNLWWIRVRGPISRVRKPRSTGYAELRDANRVARKLEEFAENRQQWEWLELVVTGGVELRQVYDHAAAGTLHALRAELEQAATVALDEDVEPWVSTWETEHLALQSISAGQKADYVRQVRALIPEGVPFPRSAFTEDKIKSTLLSRKDTRTGLPISSSTRRRYLVAWELFYRYAKKRVPLTVNPFEDVEEWRPSNGSPRSTFWDHDTRVGVVERMTNPEARAAIALTLGSGIELTALQSLTHADVGADKERTVVAHGTKNGHREDRTVFVDKWAWKEFQAFRPLGMPRAKVFRLSEAEIRQNFYEAQVAQGLIAEPETSGSYKKLWKAVKPHTIHDARHTYVVNRLLGLDGEPKQDLKYCATQLGHADEQMVMKIYGKANIRERLRLIELGEARKQGALEAQGK
jgi:integrase